MASSSGYNRDGYDDYTRRLEQQRAEANVFPPRETRHHTRTVVEYLGDDSTNASRIGNTTVLSPLQKKAQQAAYAKSIADDKERAARILAQERSGNANFHRSLPRKQPTDTPANIDEVNILSGIGASENDYLAANGKDRKKNQQMEYASQLQRQQETQELYRAEEQRRLDALRHGVPQQKTEFRHQSDQQPQFTGPGSGSVPAPRRRIATPGGPRGSEASYYDLGGDGSGMLATFGADPNAQAIKKREMRSQYAKQLQEQREQENQQQQQYHHQQQPLDGNMSCSNAANHRIQQQQQQQQLYHPSSSSHRDASSYDASAGYDYGYDAEHQGEHYHNNSNSNNHSNKNNSNSYNLAANIVSEQEQKRRQQKKYYDEIALAAAAAPIRLDRLPVQRNSTPKNLRRPPGAADVLQGTGTGLQIGGGGGGGGAPSSSVNAYPPGGGGMGGVVSRGKITVLDPDAADSRARRYHQQQEYARQLDSDAAVNPYVEDPSSAYHSGGRRSGGGTLRRTGNDNEPDVNPYSGFGFRRNDNGYAISKDQGVFGPYITEEEIAARNTAKKRAAQQEYKQQLEEFESNKVRSAANTANLARLSLYRTQQLQKEQEQKNLAYAATIRYQGESPLTPKHSVPSSQTHSHHDDHPRSSYEQGLDNGRHRNDTPYRDNSGQDMGDNDDPQQPYPYEDRQTLSGRGVGGSSSSWSRRELDTIDMQINTHRRQQQKQYHIALENDAKTVLAKPSYTPLPRRSNATRELDERDYPYRQHGSSSYKGDPSAGHNNNTSSSSHQQYSHRGLGYSESLHQPGRDAYDGNVRAQIRSRAGTIAGVINGGYEGSDMTVSYPNRGHAAGTDYSGGGISDPSTVLPSYRSSGQQGGGGTGYGGYTPQTNGSGAVTGTTTPGGSSSEPALNYNNKSAATINTTSASRQYLFGAAGGPSVGAPTSQAQGIAQPQSDYGYGGGTHASVQQPPSSFAHGAKGPSYGAYSGTHTPGGPSSSRGFQSKGSGLSSRQPPQGQGLDQDYLNNTAANSNTYHPGNVLNSGRSAGASARARGSTFMLQ